MKPRRVTADRALWLAALADAIDWQESLLATRDPAPLHPGYSCCEPGARCERYRSGAALLAAYRKARASTLARRPATRTGAPA